MQSDPESGTEMLAPTFGSPVAPLSKDFIHLDPIITIQDFPPSKPSANHAFPQLLPEQPSIPTPPPPQQ
ncbi:hypothetical protein P9112_001321 [Eukaryota sp. TZLM1-RC]